MGFTVNRSVLVYISKCEREGKEFKDGLLTKTGSVRPKLNARAFIPVTFLLLTLIFFVIVSPVSADPGVIYVNNATGQDTWDGQSLIYNNTTGSGPKSSIKSAVSVVTTGGKVNVANGNYAGPGNTNIQIAKSVTITGQSRVGTVINAGGNSQIFIVQPGVTLALEKLTLKNGTADMGGAIYSSGTLKISDTSFNSNNAVRGGAIYNYAGNLTVTGGKFTKNGVTYNGAAIYNYDGKLTVINSTFTNNSATTEGWGGGIYNNGGTTTVTGSKFVGNNAEHGGGIHNKIGYLTVTSSTFTGNTATIGGSAVCNGGDSSITYVNFCRITGNSAPSVYNKKSGVLGAENNWWGSNNPNFDQLIGRDYGDVIHNQWIVLSVSADPGTINHDATSRITADLTHNNRGTDTSKQGHIPDNASVTFTADKGTIHNGSTLNGKATVTYNSRNSGETATITGKVDDQLISTNVTIKTAGKKDVYISPSGSDVTGNGNQNNPYQTINKATTVLNPNGTIYLVSGTYNLAGDYNIEIKESMTITGAGKSNTIIDALGKGIIFIIKQGVTVNIKNLTLKNGKASDGGAINNKGTLNITNCDLTANTATSTTLGGGAIYNTGTLTITGSTLSQNRAYGGGGAIYNAGTLTVTSSTMNQNTGDINGGAVFNTGSKAILYVKNSTFTGNFAGVGGGAIDNCDYNSVTIIGSTFTNNSCGERHGGAIDSWKNEGTAGTVTVRDCIFIGNSAKQSGGAFNIDDGCTGSLINCTFTGNTAERGGAVTIWDTSSLNVTNCTFTGNKVQDPIRGYGGAINTHNFSTANITNCTFTGNSAKVNGGAVSNFKSTTTLTNCTFTGNSAPTGGALDNDRSSTLTVTYCTFTGNTATNGGVANNYDGSTLNITYSTFKDNTATTKGGVIDNTATLITHYNRIVGNSAPSGSAIYNNGGSVDARYNWWGINNNPSGFVTGGGTVGPWMVLNIALNPDTIPVGNKTAITVELLHDSNGVYHDPKDGHVPDGIPATFQATNGTVNPAKTFKDGSATSNFTANYPGQGIITATVDNQLLSVNVTIHKIDPNLKVLKRTTYNGQTTNLTAALTDGNNIPLSGKTITFRVNGSSIGTATTGTDGRAFIAYQFNSTGDYRVSVDFAGDEVCNSVNGTGTLTVEPAAALYLNIKTSNSALDMGETFIITFKLGNQGPDDAENVTVTFQIPENLELVGISVDVGSYTYDPATRTVTWTLKKVLVGDPYLFLEVKALKSGSIVITPTITSSTYNLNSDVQSALAIDIQAPSDDTGRSTLIAASEHAGYITMQKTGTPTNYLLLAVLMVISGFLIPKRK